MAEETWFDEGLRLCERIEATYEKSPKGFVPTRALLSWVRLAPRKRSGETRDLWLRALALFRHEPLARLTGAKDLLIREATSKDPRARDIAHDALLSRWRQLDPREEARLLCVRMSLPWAHRALYAVIAEDDDTLAELLAAHPGGLDEAQTLELEGWTRRVAPDEAALLRLERVYRLGTWIVRPELVRRLAQGSDPRWLPALFSIAQDAEPTLLLAIIDALSELGHVSAEPVLLEVAGRGVSDAVALRIGQVLGALGTPRALGTLDQLSRAPFQQETRDALTSARDAILERHPLQATHGSLSLSDADHTEGALSLAELGPGELELYRASERRLRELARDQSLVRPDADGALGPMVGWEQLAPAPRAPAFNLWLEVMLRGFRDQSPNWGVTLLGVAFVFLGLIVGHDIVTYLGAGLFTLGALLYLTLITEDPGVKWETLRMGHLGEATVQRVRRRGFVIEHELEVTNPEGTRVIALHRLRPILDVGARLPVLAHRDYVVLLEELDGVVARRDGAMEVRRPQKLGALGVILGTLLLIAAVIALTAWLL